MTIGRILWLAAGAIAGVIALIVVCIFGFKAVGRYQARADANNKVKVSAILIRNQEQRVKIEQQQAQIRYVRSVGIRRAQDEIAKTLTPLYVQFEMIEALKQSHAQLVYIPTDPGSGLPVVTTRNSTQVTP